MSAVRALSTSISVSYDLKQYRFQMSEINFIRATRRRHTVYNLTGHRHWITVNTVETCLILNNIDCGIKGLRSVPAQRTARVVFEDLLARRVGRRSLDLPHAVGSS